MEHEEEIADAYLQGKEYGKSIGYRRGFWLGVLVTGIIFGLLAYFM